MVVLLKLKRALFHRCEHDALFPLCLMKYPLPSHLKLVILSRSGDTWRNIPITNKSEFCQMFLFFKSIRKNVVHRRLQIAYGEVILILQYLPVLDRLQASLLCLTQLKGSPYIILDKNVFKTYLLSDVFR